MGPHLWLCLGNTSRCHTMQVRLAENDIKWEHSVVENPLAVVMTKNPVNYYK